jgi:hypothetical protein
MAQFVVEYALLKKSEWTHRSNVTAGNRQWKREVLYGKWGTRKSHILVYCVGNADKSLLITPGIEIDHNDIMTCFKIVEDRKQD